MITLVTHKGWRCKIISSPSDDSVHGRFRFSHFPDSALATLRGSSGLVGFDSKVSRMGGMIKGKSRPTAPMPRLHITTGSWCMASVNHRPSRELILTDEEGSQSVSRLPPVFFF